MKKLIVMAATAALFTSVSVSTFAARKSFEDTCKAQAEKHEISADMMDAYVKECVEKHMKKAVKRKDMKQAPKTEAPTVPASPAEPTK
jgi:hypothetical protein